MTVMKESLFPFLFVDMFCLVSLSNPGNPRFIVRDSTGIYNTTQRANCFVSSFFLDPLASPNRSPFTMIPQRRATARLAGWQHRGIGTAGELHLPKSVEYDQTDQYNDVLYKVSIFLYI